MAEIGVSTACFYPLETELSFKKLAENGVACTELFFNTPSEISESFLAELKVCRDAYGVKILSIHPFMSFAESFYLFSNYRRRYEDSLAFYERFFEIAAGLGAKFFVFHGAKPSGSFPDEEYFERFAVLTALGKKHSVQVCQENVVHYRSESPGFLLRMAQYIGEDFGVTFDIKQARRAKYSNAEFLSAVGPYIRHVHVSDYTAENTCVAPGAGSFEFDRFFGEMRAIGYDGAYIVELYRDSYADEAEVFSAYENLRRFLL